MCVVGCLSCGAEIDLGQRPRLFATVYCASCQQSFVVIEIDPPEICYPVPDYRTDGSSAVAQED
jgi:hypothetical protein